MPRTFKLSFPLPRRKSSSDKQSPQRMYSDDTDDSPICSPGVKAEKVLGTGEHNNLDLLEQPPRRPKRLRKHPSFMSVTISDTGSDSAREPDDDPSSTRSMSGERTHVRPAVVRNQPSSPLLGQSFSTALERWNSNSDMSSPKAQYSPSSSTSQSHYDAAKSPLLISQQTSASSTRDMALRKGCPPVSSPLARTTVDEHFQNLMVNDPAQEPLDSTKRRPQYIDMSALLPDPNRFDPPVHSPHLFSKSPAQPSLITRTTKSLSDKTRWLGWERKKTKQPESGLSQSFNAGSHQQAKMPHNNSISNANTSAHDRFDKIDTSPSAGVLEPELDPRIAPAHTFPTASRTPSKTSRNSTLSDVQAGSRKSSFGKISQSGLLTQPKIEYSFGQTLASLPRDKVSSQPCEIRSTPSTRSQRSLLSSQSHRNTLSGMDLQNQSVLALSSSEDESEESVLSSDTVRRHHIRESIDYADRGEEAMVLRAERVKSLKPQPVVNVRSRRASRSSSSGVVPPVPSIPTRPLLSPRVSSMKWQEHKNIRSALDAYSNGFDPDWEPSATGSRTSQSSRSSSQRRLNGRESKMMAVTPDEERLLEGMRRKRASIRQESAADGFSKRDSQLYSVREPPTARPKTADEDKRPRFRDKAVPQSPPVMSEELLRSLSGSYAASADDLTREIEYFPQVPEAPVRLRSIGNNVSSPKKSPSLSFTASDLVPSTPRSRRSPITPPPGVGFLEAYPGSHAVSPSRSAYAVRNTHERKRTASSSVVVLDGAEQRAQQLDEEDDITGWAMNRW